MSYRSLLATACATAALSLGTTVPAHAVFFHVGSGSIDGSLCVGFDCVSAEVFGFDTLRLKENNLRMHYDDTSVAAAFPNVDWRVRVNDSANGGASYYAIENVSAGRTPFRVDDGARNNALYVDDQGDVGIGTATPSTDLHISIGDTPTVRLEQNTSSGFGAQTWDLAGNETNFFIRDVTGGSLLPFRIRPDAPTNSIMIDAVGNVGLGTASPDGPLHIADDSAYITLGDTNDNDKWFITHAAGNNGNLEFTNELDASGSFTLTMVMQPDGDVRLAGDLGIADGTAEPAVEAGKAIIFVDSVDGDLKVKFSNGILRTIVTD